MSKLVEVLYPLPDLRRTPLSLLGWWESRRLLYNRVVGAAGLFTLLANAALMTFVPHPTPLDVRAMLVVSAVYGLAANVCYSLGWLLEVVALAVWGRSAPRLGPLLFRQGLIFSVGLTLLPVLFASVSWVVRVVLAVVG
ncbi:MAG TPA: hypothetical protein VFU47_04685 [Armatimonadota bacterium]|nr:hypothetical protein [Armatimonadota bacterium]